MERTRAMRCLHCETPTRDARRGLCRPCYNSPARELYPPIVRSTLPAGTAVLGSGNASEGEEDEVKGPFNGGPKPGGFEFPTRGVRYWRLRGKSEEEKLEIELELDEEREERLGERRRAREAASAGKAGARGGSGAKPSGRRGSGVARTAADTIESRVATASAAGPPRGFGPGGKPYPREPTTWLPGTGEKMAVLRERAMRREELHHPLDATLDGWGGGEALFLQFQKRHGQARPGRRTETER